MDNLNYWPYTDIHELNLDWILEKVKALDAKLDDDIDKYVQEYIDEHFEEWTVNANYDPDTQTIVYTNGTGAQQTLGDVIRFAIDNVFVKIKDDIARTAAAAAQGTADTAVQNAATAQSTAAAAQNTANANTSAISALDTKIEAHIPILWNLVTTGNLSAGQQTANVITGRKLSDFNMLVIQWLRSGSLRETAITSEPLFAGGQVCELVNVDSSNTQRWIDVAYVSDTQIQITTASNITNAETIRIFGVGSIHTEG